MYMDKNYAEKRFMTVKDILLQKRNVEAYNRAYKKNWKFYKQHTIGECLEILIKESGECNQ